MLRVVYPSGFLDRAPKPRFKFMRRILLIILFFTACRLEAEMFHRQESCHEEWQQLSIAPFDTLFLSWNGERPREGSLRFYVSVEIGGWSPWLLYAIWGREEQASFSSSCDEGAARSYQDAIEILEGKKATGFKIQVVGESAASLLYSLHVYTNGENAPNPPRQSTLSSLCLPVTGLSQMALSHPRCRDLCSPTSTTAVIRYLSSDCSVDPLLVAEGSWDSSFDIYGNWVLNLAAASERMGPEWCCWVERLDSWESLYSCLARKTPVVTSVRGPLPGSAAPYAKGHLMVVIGYDAERRRVLCMDPAFPNDSATLVSYDLQEWLEAWGRRGRIAYVFQKTNL